MGAFSDLVLGFFSLFSEPIGIRDAAHSLGEKYDVIHPDNVPKINSDHPPTLSLRSANAEFYYWESGTLVAHGEHIFFRGKKFHGELLLWFGDGALAFAVRRLRGKDSLQTSFRIEEQSHASDVLRFIRQHL